MLVAPDWLAAHVDDPKVVPVDASWYLPDAGRDARAEFEAGHVPGSVPVDLAGDLADPAAAVRNTLLSPEALAQAFARLGIGSADTVVVYDRLGGYSAGRVWWALRVAGHPDARLLDGGFAAYARLGPVARGAPRARGARAFEPRPWPAGIVDRDFVLRCVRSREAVIVDARSPARFRGEAPESVGRAGRIPGSRNVPWDANLEGDPPQLRPAAALRALYAEAGVDFDRAVVTTCGSGVTASFAAFALRLAGHEQVAVYDGSWAEWGADPGLPLETGPDTLEPGPAT